MCKEFYTGLIEATDNNQAFVQVFYAYGSHIGEAIDSMLSYAIEIGLKNPKVVEADFYQFENLSDDAMKVDGLDIYFINERYYFPINEFTSFQLPYGVILSCIEGEFEPELIKEGFTRYTDDNEIKHLDIVIDRSKLLDAFLSIAEKLNSIRVLWVRLEKDWEDGQEFEFYANESLNNISNIKNFILDNINDILLNGYLSTTIYSSDGATNVSIDKHKKIHISTKSSEFIDLAANYIENMNLNFYDFDNFYSIDYGYYHYHYRPTNSKSRMDLIKHLKENGFYLWRRE